LVSLALSACSFSPLHEGDASVTNVRVHLTYWAGPFQSPSRGGRLCDFCPAS